MWHGYYFGGGWWMLGLGLVFWGSIVALIVWSVRRGRASTADSDGSARDKRPIDYLKERYAKGEIGRDEFERVKQHLKDE
ncbi:MAG: SHOCT domain-containing protein [Candidatus Bipolaricaulis sp.]|nr:SHOCT domain-containing protein [Candidatus Bipolaricaulis sp.]